MKDSLHLRISITTQTLRLLQGTKVLRTFPVFTSAKGIGFEPESFRTPVGNFVVADKVGAGAPLGTIFKARQPTGVWQPGTPTDHDLVLTRILVLDGLDPANRNTRGRHIYLHGTNREDLVGQPASMGCVRLTNPHVAELFDLVTTGTPVTIEPPNRSDMKLLFIDGESSLMTVDAIRELAAAAGGDAADRDRELLASASGLPADELLARRLHAIRPDAETCRLAAKRCLASLANGAAKAIAQARDLGWTPILLSNSVMPVLEPLAAKLGIHHVEAVPLHHAEDGTLTGIDTHFPTLRRGGMAAIIARWISATRPLLTAMAGTRTTEPETQTASGNFLVCADPSPSRGAKQPKPTTGWKELPRFLGKLAPKHSAASETRAKHPTTRKKLSAATALHERPPRNTGIRYSTAQRAEVVAFVHEFNRNHGRGGQAAAAAKFAITPLTISAWLRKPAKGTPPPR